MKTGHNYYVYIVKCSDGLYYTGITNDLERRIAQHNDGADPYSFTFKRRPVVLKYAEHFFHADAAISYEKQLKGWSRKKKEALFKKDYIEISRLAKSRKVKRN